MKYIIGSFSKVKLARNIKNNKYYAIKIFKKFDLIEEKITQHIFKEAKVLSIINHTFLVILYIYIIIKNSQICIKFQLKYVFY